MDQGQSTYELYRSVRDANQIFKLPPWDMIPQCEKTAWAAVEGGGVRVPAPPVPATPVIPPTPGPLSAVVTA